jgi:predicted 3-demethylubiquinone-9 3-methyltransferase (glyoxalase superfamily)/uncharacterized protein YndB with AHSA1/START domain
MNLSATFKLTPRGEREILMTRAFDASRDLVFEALTKPALVQRWLLGPPGWTMPVCEIDLRVGGRYRYVWRNQDGREMGVTGLYRSIERPGRIVHTENFDEAWYAGESLITTELVEKGGRTEMTATLLYESKDARDSVLKSGMEGGVTQSYDRLEALLTENTKGIAMQKITPFLWFDTQAEEAANFYVSIFKNSKITKSMRGPDGKMLTVGFELDGQHFTALNGGPHFKFTEAISFVVDCKSQAEVDELWEKLIADGGSPSQCGWLKDKYGVSWQITPTVLIELVTDPDKEKAGRVFQAMMQMGKIDIAKLLAAAKG